jgi:hypothetical protein
MKRIDRIKQIAGLKQNVALEYVARLAMIRHGEKDAKQNTLQTLDGAAAWLHGEFDPADEEDTGFMAELAYLLYAVNLYFYSGSNIQNADFVMADMTTVMQINLMRLDRIVIEVPKEITVDTLIAVDKKYAEGKEGGHE